MLYLALLLVGPKAMCRVVRMLFILVDCCRVCDRRIMRGMGRQLRSSFGVIERA